jgi:hypothetical protein
VLSTNAAIFTTGSCFARNIERALVAANMNVISWTPASGIPNDHMHRYNTFSMLQDFVWAFDETYDGSSVIALENGAYVDYTGYGIFSSREEAVTARKRVISLHRNVQSSDLLIVTLGLVEAWHDLATGQWLNIAPSRALAMHPGRFECRITDYAENLRCLQTLVDTVRTVSRRITVVVTVSPVPFSATFSGQDVVVANTYSKSVLRAVAGEISERNESVHYFPSYEMVTLSDPALVWWPDKRHIRPDIVTQIVKQFHKQFFAGAVPEARHNPVPSLSL